MNDIALERLRVLSVPRGGGLSPKRRLVLLSELASLGYLLENPEALAASDDALFEDYPALIEALRALRGGDVDYVPLFLGFPDEVPDDDEYYYKRIIGFLGNLTGVFPDGTLLETGLVVSDWLFDLSRFGADPISQLQDSTLFERGRQALAGRAPDDHVEWIGLQVVPADEVPGRLRAWMHQTLYAKSSIKAALHDDLRTLLTELGTDGLELERVVMKENRALLARLLWETGQGEALAELIASPTDLLRMFAALTGTDVSLAQPIRFPKLPRARRRQVLSLLEGCAGLAEDLGRYRGLWLEIGRYLHPTAYQSAFPRTAEAFAAVRADAIRGFDARTEHLLTAADLDGLLAHLGGRPGNLARKLHELLRRFPDRTDEVLSAFEAVVHRVPLKSLLVLQAYFGTIDAAERRTVINKLGKIVVLANNARGALGESVRSRVSQLLERALLAQLSTRPSWQGKTVYIDPALARYTVPLQQRAASDGLLTLGRGSRIPVDFDKVLRLFVYWKQTARCTDLDLSVMQLDEHFGYLGHVSYTNLSDQGIRHSGDLQDGTYGAAEFIDISLSALDPEVRYLATQVYRYAGEQFAQMTCHAGWMIRDHVDVSMATFDIKTVQNAFDLAGTGAYSLPLLVDLAAGEIVWVDLYMGGKTFFNNVEGAFGNVSAACRELARFTETRPNLFTLASLHRTARGGVPSDDPHADVSFGVSGCTYDAGDVEIILSELL